MIKEHGETGGTPFTFTHLDDLKSFEERWPALARLHRTYVEEEDIKRLHMFNKNAVLRGKLLYATKEGNDETIVGYCQTIPFETILGDTDYHKIELTEEEKNCTWIIAGIGVDPDYRSRGLGKLLVQKIMSQVLGKNPNAQMIARIEHYNKPSIKLHKRLGFVPILGTETYSMYQLKTLEYETVK